MLARASMCFIVSAMFITGCALESDDQDMDDLSTDESEIGAYGRASRGRIAFLYFRKRASQSAKLLASWAT
jgi:hypothetical protein